MQEDQKATQDLNSSLPLRQNQILPQKRTFVQTILSDRKYPIIIFVIIFILPIAYVLQSLQVKKDNKQPLQSKVPIQSAYTKGAYVEDQIIVKYKEGVSQELINENLKKYNSVVSKRIDAIHRLVINTPPGQGDEIFQSLQKDNLIESAERDYINTANYTPNDPYLNLQWGLINSGDIVESEKGTPEDDVKAEIAWDYAKGENIYIAIIDSGIDKNHPDLSSKIVAEKDFVGIGISDRYGHGTHTAGIAAAETNNAVGIAGMCPECKLLIAKALDDNGRGPDSVWLDALIWAADNGAKVANLSFVNPENSTAKQDAINYAWNKGVVLVGGAGNKFDTEKNYPAANNHVISVAATDNNDEKSYFSTYGDWVLISAPGSSIYSTFPTFESKLQENTFQNPNYGYLSGTSMATPIVSGIAGLVWSSPFGSSAQAVVDRVLNTADKIPGTGEYWKYGRVNAARAVGAFSDSPTPSPTTIPTRFPSPTSLPSLTPTPVFTPTLIPTKLPTSTPTPILSRNSPTPTLVPTVAYTSPYPTSPYIVNPTLFCLGSCSQPTPTNTPTPKPTIIDATTPTPTKVITPSPFIIPASPTPAITVPFSINQPSSIPPTPIPDDQTNIILDLIYQIKSLLDTIIKTLTSMVNF